MEKQNSGEPESNQAQWRRPDRGVATVVIMLVACCSATIGDLLLSKAMRGLGPLGLKSGQEWWEGGLSTTDMLSGLPAEVYILANLVFGIPNVWLAIACLLVFLALFLIALSWSDLTVVMPLTAMTYILNAIAVGPVLGEHVSLKRWMGTLLIAIGVAIITLDLPKKPAPLQQ